MDWQNITVCLENMYSERIMKASLYKDASSANKPLKSLFCAVVLPIVMALAITIPKCSVFSKLQTLTHAIVTSALSLTTHNKLNFSKPSLLFTIA